MQNQNSRRITPPVTFLAQQALDLIDKKELQRRLSLPSTRMVDELMKRRKIPFLRLGHKTVRFSWAKVQAALAKFEHKAVGQ